MREAFQRIKLEREWVCGKQIGSGGFGKVFEARTDDCQSAVAKFVDKTEGAQRDLLVVNLDDARNTIPILEHGEIQDYFVLIMPRAEKSLRQYLKEKKQAPFGIQSYTDPNRCCNHFGGPRWKSGTSRHQTGKYIALSWDMVSD